MFEKPNFSEPSGLDTFRAAAESFQRPLETPPPPIAPVAPEVVRKGGLSKETIIGLVVIGSLIVVFGGLLMRKISSDGSTPAAQDLARADAQPPSSAGMDARPSVVLPQLGLADRVDAASGHDQLPVTEGNVDVANRKFMPAENPALNTIPAEQPSIDRYRHAEPNSDTTDNAAAPAAANPFVHKASAAEAADVAATEPSDEPQSPAADGLELPAQGVEPAAAPLRRLKATAPTRNGEELTEAPRFGAEPARTATEEPSAEEPAADEPVADDAPLDIEPANERARPARFAPPTDPLGDEPPIEAADTARQNERPAATGRDWRAGATELNRAPIEPQGAPANGKYTVQPNDNLWIISEKAYGTGGYFKALREHNRAALPRADKLVVGSVLAVPPVATLEQNFPSLCPKQRKSALVKPRTMQASTQGRRATASNVYVVEQGDTLFDIARYELGKASRWAEIYDLNRDVLGEDFDHLSPGTELTLPAKQGADSFTRQDDSRYQR
jgi:nucleoid-associated protein YgaU